MPARDSITCAEALASHPWALKEWASVVDALLAGETALLVRKGGIHEPGFAIRADHAWLFPTAFHDGAAPGDTPTDAPAALAASRTAGVPLRGAVTVVDKWRLTDASQVQAVAPWSALSPEALAERYTLRPQHALWAVLVRTFPSAEATTVPWHRSYGGCRSWVELRAAVAGQLGPAALDEAQLSALRGRIHGALHAA